MALLHWPILISRLSGVHMESQTAYELACEGLIRPTNNKLPVLYGIRCVHFNTPNFTLGKHIELTSCSYHRLLFWFHSCTLDEIDIKFYYKIFVTEVQSVNEYDKYLWTIIHDLGVQLKTAAYCTGVQCTRQGKFEIELALLRKHWQLQHIVKNMEECHEVLDVMLLRPESAILTA